MQIEVVYCGVLKDLFGCQREEVYLAEDDTVAMLLAVLRERLAVETKVWSSLGRRGERRIRQRAKDPEGRG